ETAAAVPDMEPHPDVVQNAHTGKELDVLEGARDPQAQDLVCGVLQEIFTREVDAPRLWCVQACDAVEERRLAGAVGADQADHGTLGNLERDLVERPDAAEPDAQFAD